MNYEMTSNEAIKFILDQVVVLNASNMAFMSTILTEVAQLSGKDPMELFNQVEASARQQMEVIHAKIYEQHGDIDFKSLFKKP